jgi:hypothetical protein
MDADTTEAPGLKRAQSTPAVAKFPMSTGLVELKRTFSESGIGVPTASIPQMVGFGKYRRAVDASASWQLRYLEQKLHFDGDIIAGFLGDEPPMGLDVNIWQEYRTIRVKRLRDSRSAASSIFRSSRTNSSTVSPGTPGAPITDASSEYTDPVTGTKIVRGFTISDSATISRVTSAASSAKKEWTPPNEKKKGRLSVISKIQNKEVNSDASDCAVASDDDDSDWIDMD